MFLVNLDLPSFFPVINCSHSFLYIVFPLGCPHVSNFILLKSVNTLNCSEIVLTLYIFLTWVSCIQWKRNTELEEMGWRAGGGRRTIPFKVCVFANVITGSLGWVSVGWTGNDLSLLLRIRAETLRGAPGARPSIGTPREYFAVSVFKHHWLLFFLSLICNRGLIGSEKEGKESVSNDNIFLLS